MLRYKSLFFIESENYLFKYNTNDDRLTIIKEKNDDRIKVAKETEIGLIYEREMIEQALDKRYYYE